MSGVRLACDTEGCEALFPPDPVKGDIGSNAVARGNIRTWAAAQGWTCERGGVDKRGIDTSRDFCPAHGSGSRGTAAEVGNLTSQGAVRERSSASEAINQGGQSRGHTASGPTEVPLPSAHEILGCRLPKMPVPANVNINVKPMVDGAAMLRVLEDAWDQSPMSQRLICRQLGIR